MTISGGGWELREKGTKRIFWNHGTAMLNLDQKVLSTWVLCILKYVNYNSKKKKGEEVSWKIEQRSILECIKKRKEKKIRA